HALPRELLSPKPPRHFRFAFPRTADFSPQQRRNFCGSSEYPNPARFLQGNTELPPFEPNLEYEPLFAALPDFLNGISDHIIELLNNNLPSPETLTGFDRSFQTHDLELLTEFYRL